MIRSVFVSASALRSSPRWPPWRARGGPAARSVGQPTNGSATARGELCAPEELPAGFAAGFGATLPLVDMPVYLDYLVRRLTAAGGQIELAEVGSLTELAEQAPLLANCAGLGARDLVPDPSVRPVRGQQVIVDNPGLEEFFIEAPFGAAWTAYWPYPDHVVLGGGRPCQRGCRSRRSRVGRGVARDAVRSALGAAGPPR